MGRICSVEGCERPHAARGMCSMHLKRKNYKPQTPPRKLHGEVVLFLLQEVIPYRGDDCLIWPFARNAKGRGQLTLKGASWEVHRLVCWSTNGAPPNEESEARHSCGNGHLGCVSPSHISWGTTADNQRDRLKHQTDNRGERHGRHKLTEKDVRELRKLLAAGGEPRSLAAKFGVHVRTVQSIQSRKNWAWLD